MVASVSPMRFPWSSTSRLTRGKVRRVLARRCKPEPGAMLTISCKKHVGRRIYGRRRLISCVLGLSTIFATIGCSPDQKENTPIASEARTTLFETSCAENVQIDFQKAVSLLHSFEYVETAKRFSDISDRNPVCAMAYWGQAMSIWHPLWAPPNQDELERGAEILAQTDGLAVNAKEAGYIKAIKAFFSSSDISTNTERVSAYAQAMGEVLAAYPDDPETAIFYALAVRATASPRDKSYVKQHEAAGILKELGKTYPTHPGILHYIIHSYDYPGLAHLALGEANLYAETAKDSAHAQHMPSHIFTRLGLWEKSLASNHDSTKSAADYTVHAGLPGHYDEGLHSIDYLMYAMLQTARDDDAKALLDRLGAIKKTDTENFKVAYTYAASPARYVLERRTWAEASNLKIIRPDFRWDDFGWAKSIHHFARGLGAARLGNIEQARKEVDIIRGIQVALPETTMPYLRMQVEVQADIINSWIMLAEQKPEEALALAASLAEREDAVDKHPVTPGEVLPARELYADMLSEIGDFSNALAQYEIVLSASPNRLNALLGAANASKRAGNAEQAQNFVKIIRSQTKDGNQQRSGLSKVRD